MITILGPTACGKTSFAVNLANKFGGEIISADSRQVFKGMDIGTGKDLDEYIIDGNKINHHLIDIREPGYEYSVFEFQKDFVDAYKRIEVQNKIPILCGGTGLYIESVLKGYHLSNVPENPILRKSLEPLTDEELTEILKTYISLHNNTDTETRERLIRAIEIQEYQSSNPESYIEMPTIKSLVIGVVYPRDIVMKRIEQRLEQRLNSGMIDEIQKLLNSGIPSERLIKYGLEYKYVTMYLMGNITYSEMFEKLNIAIRQFAKRQMTWFRRMERNGINIEWIDGQNSMDEKITVAEELIARYELLS
jgi:tRNA dimethylallyltransferase